MLLMINLGFGVAPVHEEVLLSMFLVLNNEEHFFLHENYLVEPADRHRRSVAASAPGSDSLTTMMELAAGFWLLD